MIFINNIICNYTTIFSWWFNFFLVNFVLFYSIIEPILVQSYDFFPLTWRQISVLFWPWYSVVAVSLFWGLDVFKGQYLSCKKVSPSSWLWPLPPPSSWLWLLPPPSVSTGTSVRQSLSFSVCWWHQHSSAVAAQQLRLQLAWTTGYANTAAHTNNHTFSHIFSRLARHEYFFLKFFDNCGDLSVKNWRFSQQSVDVGAGDSAPPTVSWSKLTQLQQKTTTRWFVFLNFLLLKQKCTNAPVPMSVFMRSFRDTLRRFQRYFGLSPPADQPHHGPKPSSRLVEAKWIL